MTQVGVWTKKNGLQVKREAKKKPKEKMDQKKNKIRIVTSIIVSSLSYQDIRSVEIGKKVVSRCSLLRDFIVQKSVYMHMYL